MDSKPFYQSMSFWGLVVGVGAPLLAKAGITVDPTALTNAIVGVVGAVVGLIGIFRRPDIHIIPPLS